MKVWLVGRPECWWDTSAVYDNEEAARAHAALCHLDLTEDEALSVFDPIALGLCPGCGIEEWELRHREGCPEVDWAPLRERKERAARDLVERLAALAADGDTGAREQLSWYAGRGDKEAQKHLAALGLDARYVS